jgi:hypothetical protein
MEDTPRQSKEHELKQALRLPSPRSCSIAAECGELVGVKK